VISDSAQAQTSCRPCRLVCGGPRQFIGAHTRIYFMVNKEHQKMIMQDNAIQLGSQSQCGTWFTLACLVLELA